jgi:hypothetical protein
MKIKIISLLFLSFFILGCSSFQERCFRAQEELKNLQGWEAHGHLHYSIKVPDAIFTLVHIRQQHDSELYTRKVLADLRVCSDKEKIIKSFYKTILKLDSIQQEIVNFINSCSSERHRVYSEGMGYPKLYRTLFINSHKEKRISEIEDVLKQSVETLNLPEPAYFLGASFIIHEGRSRQVLGAEHEGLLNLALATYNNPALNPQSKMKLLQECHEQRESEILKNIIHPDSDAAYRDPSLKFVILGSMHSFKNNILAWNKTHALKKFNLVVFTPKSLQEFNSQE